MWFHDFPLLDCLLKSLENMDRELSTLLKLEKSEDNFQFLNFQHYVTFKRDQVKICMNDLSQLRLTMGAVRREAC